MRCAYMLLFAVIISGCSMNANHQISEADVRDFLTRYEHASATQAFANVVGLIHPDALFRFSDGDFRGREAIQAAFERTWAYDLEDERYYLTDVEVMNTDANSATATFTFNWSGTAPEGPFEIAGRGTVVLVRHDGKLKILIEHLSR